MIFRPRLRWLFLMGFLIYASLAPWRGYTSPVQAPAATRQRGDDRETRERKIAFNQAIQDGDAGRTRGDTRAALERYHDALNVARVLASESLEASAREHIGDLWIATGQTAKAIYAFQESLKLYQAGKNPDKAIRVNLKLGFASYLQNDFATSLKHYTETLALARASQDLPGELDALQSLGNLHRTFGHIQPAREHLEAAWPLANKQGWRQASIQVNLASVYNALNDPEQALRYAEQARSAGQALQRPSVLWHANFEAGLARGAMGQPDEATRHYRQAIEILESPAARVEPLGPAIEFITPKAQPYERLVAALGARYQEKPSADLRRDAFIYAERARLQSIVNALESYSIRVPYRRADIDWATREAHLRAELTRIMSDLRASPPAQPVREDLQQKLKKLSAEYEEFIQEVRARDPFYASLKYPRPHTPEDAQQKVLRHSDTAILAYFLAEPASYVWVITKTRFEWYTLPGRQEIVTTVADFRQELMSSSDAPSFVENGQKLYQALIAPTQDELVGVRHLSMVPHDVLFTLPMEALHRATPPAGPPGKFKALMNKLLGRAENPKWHYLLEDYTVSASSSVSALVHVQQTRGARTRDMDNLLALANPSHGPGSPVNPAVSDPSLVLGSLYKGPQGTAKFSVEEIQAIAKLFPRKSERLLIGEEAKESVLKKSIASYYRIIHFAVPGVIDVSVPSLVVLSLAPDPPEKEDGRLDLSEIFQLNLNADLVTLSACEVGFSEGGLMAGTDPLAGVAPLAVATRAFMHAGVSTVLVSLWAVNQRSTVDLMQDFYSNLLSGMNKRDALHLAKLHMLKSGDTPHAYYWSGFSVYGDADTALFLPQPVSKFQIAGIVLGVLFVGYILIRLYYGKRSGVKTD